MGTQGHGRFSGRVIRRSSPGSSTSTRSIRDSVASPWTRSGSVEWVSPGPIPVGQQTRSYRAPFVLGRRTAPGSHAADREEQRRRRDHPGGPLRHDSQPPIGTTPLHDRRPLFYMLVFLARTSMQRATPGANTSSKSVPYGRRDPTLKVEHGHPIGEFTPAHATPCGRHHLPAPNAQHSAIRVDLYSCSRIDPR